MKDNVAKETKKRFLKKGSYSFALCVIVFAIVVAVNVFASQLPASVNQVDISQQKLYSLTDQTKAVLDNLQEDVTFYFIASSATADDILQKTLNQYEAYCSHIKVEMKDPDVNPLFTKEYTEETVEENSVIVVCGENSKVVAYADMYEQTVDYTTYQPVPTAFDGEGQLTSAITMLTNDNLPVMYTLTGHEELPLSASLKKMVEKSNISVKDLSLLTSESVPEDCEVLMILSPASDLSADDVEKIKAYMEKGGNVIVALYYNDTAMPNMDKLLSEYGVGVDKSVVLEEDTNLYAYQNPMYLVPTIKATDYTSDVSDGNTFVLTPIMQPIMQLASSDQSGLEIIPLLVTSGTSYAKKDVANMQTYVKESADELGPFSVMTVIEKSMDATVSTMAVIGSESVFDEQVNSMVSGGNYRLIMNVISQMCDFEQTISIAAKSLSYENLNITTQTAILWRNITMFVIPILFLAIGGVIWFKRRRR